MNHLEPDPPPSFWKSSAGLTLLVAGMVGAFYLVTEHRAHLFGLLPYLILLACPLMHVFMHKGHGHGGHRHSGHDHKEGPSRDQRKQ